MIHFKQPSHSFYHCVYSEAGIHPAAYPVIIWSYFSWSKVALAFNSPTIICLVPNSRKRGCISPFTRMNSLRSNFVFRVKQFLEEVDCLTQKIEDLRSSETSIKTYVNTWYKITDDILIFNKTVLRLSVPRCVLYQMRTYEFWSGRTHAKKKKHLVPRHVDSSMSLLISPFSIRDSIPFFEQYNRLKSPRSSFPFFKRIRITAVVTDVARLEHAETITRYRFLPRTLPCSFPLAFPLLFEWFGFYRSLVKALFPSSPTPHPLQF